MGGRAILYAEPFESGGRTAVPALAGIMTNRPPEAEFTAWRIAPDVHGSRT